MVFQKAVRIDPQFYEAHEELGYALYRLGRYEESINASQQATAIRSDFRPYYNMGLAYMAQKDWAGRISLLREPLPIASKTPGKRIIPMPITIGDSLWPGWARLNPLLKSWRKV